MSRARSSRSSPESLPYRHGAFNAAISFWHCRTPRPVPASHPTGLPGFSLASATRPAHSGATALLPPITKLCPSTRTASPRDRAQRVDRLAPAHRDFEAFVGRDRPHALRVGQCRARRFGQYDAGLMGRHERFLRDRDAVRYVARLRVNLLVWRLPDAVRAARSAGRAAWPSGGTRIVDAPGEA